MGVTLRLAADDIPNIRFNVAKALETMAVTLAPSSEGRQLIEADIVPALNKMQEDSDADVRYFATRAMEQTQAALADPDAVMKCEFVCFLTMPFDSPSDPYLSFEKSLLIFDLSRRTLRALFSHASFPLIPFFTLFPTLSPRSPSKDR